MLSRRQREAMWDLAFLSLLRRLPHSSDYLRGAKKEGRGVTSVARTEPACVCFVRASKNTFGRGSRKEGKGRGGRGERAAVAEEKRAEKCLLWVGGKIRPIRDVSNDRFSSSNIHRHRPEIMWGVRIFESFWIWIRKLNAMTFGGSIRLCCPLNN